MDGNNKNRHPNSKLEIQYTKKTPTKKLKKKENRLL